MFLNSTNLAPKLTTVKLRDAIFNYDSEVGNNNSEEMEPSGSEPEKLCSTNSEESSFEQERAKRCNFKSLLTVEAITFGVFLADNLSDSVTTNFIIMRACEAHFHYNKSICSQLGTSSENASALEAIIQPYSSVILTGMNFLSIMLPAIMTLFLGAWSDYNGRKPVLIIAATGYFLKYLLLSGFAWIPDLDPKFGLLAVIPVAVTGGMVNFVTAAYSYVSDITQDDNRSFRISVLEAFIYCACIIGLFSASYIFKTCVTHGYVIIYGICAGTVFVTTIWTYFFTPESIQSTENGKGLLQVFEPRLFKEMLHVCFKRREGYKRAVIFLVIIALALTISVSVGEMNVLFFYTRLQFGWKVRDYTLWASVSLTMSFVGLLFGTVLMTKCLKLSDPTVGFISYTFKAASAFFIAFVPSNMPQLMYYTGLINIFGGLCGPSARSILSKSVPKEDLGKVFGFTATSEAILPLAFGPFYTFIYNLTLEAVPSAFLYLSGCLFLVSSLFCVIIYSAQKSSSQMEYNRMENENEIENENR